ncbi:uncharacterized protein LOC143059231 [Mytilus galloprovincialis]|nr:Hypothetical predicted protein [Mytilus galloprovincialis]
MPVNPVQHRMKRIFRKISICFVFLSRINNGPIRPHQTRHGNNHHGNNEHDEHNKHEKPTSNFRVASLCFMFLRRLHAFEDHFHACNTQNHRPLMKKPKRNLSASGKCPCCNLKTDSENGEEQTKTILTHFLRDIVPKFSRICIGQNPQSSSQIWTPDKKPQKWPTSLVWKDPNNTPKDTLEVLQKKMDILMQLCDIKKIPPEYYPELQAYQEYCHELSNKKDSADISKLQILRQQRKKSHDLAQACRKFSEFVQHHGLPDKSPLLQKEIQRLSQVLHEANSNNKLASQFDEVYCAIANAEGTEKPPEEFMAQFASSSQTYTAGDIFMATSAGSFRRDNAAAYSYLTNSQGSEFQDIFYARRPCEKRVFADTTQNSNFVYNPLGGKRLKACSQSILENGFAGSGFF